MGKDYRVLLENPEPFRVGPDYRGTHRVTPVEFKGERLIVKRPGVFSNLALRYYRATDFFPGTRVACSPVEALAQEAGKLQALRFDGVPGLRYHDERGLVRSFVEGRALSELENPRDVDEAVYQGLALLRRFHGRGVLVGDSHAKNVLMSGTGYAYWLDLDGKFREDLVFGRAADLVFFVYSVWGATRNEGAVLYAAEQVRNQGRNDASIGALVDNILPGHRKLWVSIRIPRELDEDVRRLLTR